MNAEVPQVSAVTVCGGALIRPTATPQLNGSRAAALRLLLVSGYLNSEKAEPLEFGFCITVTAYYKRDVFSHHKCT